MLEDWERDMWPELIRALKGRRPVADAMILCPCKASEARGLPNPYGTGCACSGPPSTVERVVRVADIAVILEIHAAKLAASGESEGFTNV